MEHEQRKWRASIVALTTAAVLTGPLLVPVTASATESQPTEAVVEIHETVSDQGFVHPGIGLSADDLRTAQEQVNAGVEPWASYFDAMTQTTFASTDYRASNSRSATERDVPADPTFTQVGMRNRETNDSFGAVTQSLMWVMTGDEVYRRNAIQALRTWANMNPEAYTYFPDAHIHTGHPLYQFLMAAEIIRATEPLADDSPGTYGGYDVVWSDSDDAKLLANFAQPVVDTFLFSNEKWMNQHNFGLFGRIATAIYADDPDGYATGVEWLTVNGDYDGYDNGAIAPQIPVVAADNPENPYGYDFVQVREMGRDQAHAETNIDNYTGLARILEVQGTRVDPADGTVSTAPNAVSTYDFLDRRILAGADTFYGFMQGAWVPWADERGEGWDGTISQAYRGRLVNPTNELYYEYALERGVNVEEEAPWLAELSSRQDGPFYYDGTRVANFWAPGDKNPEYWVAFPEELSGTTPKPLPADSDLRFSSQSLQLDERSEIVEDGADAFLRAHADEEGTTSVVNHVMHDSAGTHAVRLRSDGPAVLEVFDKEAASSDNPDETNPQLVATVHVPDTNDEWRYVAIPEYGDNVVFLRLSSETGTTVDLDRLKLQSDAALSAPAFVQPDQPLYATKHEKSEFDVSAQNQGGDVTYRAPGLPESADLNAATGIISWTPGASERGRYDVLITADDGESITTRAFEIVASVNRQHSLKALVADLTDEDAVYTTVSREPFDSAVAAAQKAAKKGSTADFQAALSALLAAAEGLRLLNPQLADGSLNYLDGVVVPTVLDAKALANLADDSNGSGTGDYRVDSFTLDFGTRYRITPASFGLQARYTFGNRLEGTNVYGSNDGIQWDLLTERMAENLNEMQDIGVVAEHSSTPYRYLKLQVDAPGIATDPAYPGLWSFAGLRINGVRSEVASDVTSVTVTSPDALSGRVTDGDTVTIKATADKPVSDVAAAVQGQSVPLQSEDDGLTWSGSAVLAGLEGGGRLDVAIDHTTADGRAAATIHGSTDATWLFGAGEQGAVDLAGATVVDAAGAPDDAKTAQATRILDADVGTFSDVGIVNGQRFLIWDFGEGTSLSLDRLDFLPRLDNTGMVNIEGLVFEGSADLQNWSKVADSPRKTLSWQALNATGDTASRYLRVTAPRGISIIELRAFGSLEAELGPVLDRADAVNLSEYTRASQILFPREVAAVRAAADLPNADEAALVQRLMRAWDLLEKATTSKPAAIDPQWVEASTGTADGSATPAQNGWRMFDGSASTWTDTTTKACTVTVDPGESDHFDLVGLRFLPRDSAVSRSTGMAIEGSTDGGITWLPVSNTGTPARGWNTLPLVSPEQYDALRITGGNGYCNIAELEIVVEFVDRSGLDLLLSETALLVPDGWTAASWQRMLDARASSVSVPATAEQEEVDNVTEALEEAQRGLIPVA